MYIYNAIKSPAPKQKNKAHVWKSWNPRMTQGIDKGSAPIYATEN